MTLAAFLAAAGLHVLAAVSPGPAVLMSARTGVTEGLRTGLVPGAWHRRGRGGLGLGRALRARRAVPDRPGAALGASRSRAGCYLLWMAIGMWRHAAEPLLTEVTGRPPRGALSAFRLGARDPARQPQARRVLRRGLHRHRPARHRRSGCIAALLAVVFLNEAGLEHRRRPHLLARPHRAAPTSRLKSVHRPRPSAGCLPLLGIKIATT